MTNNKELDPDIIKDDAKELDLDMSHLKEFDKILGKKFGKQYHGFGDANKFESIERVSLDSISLNKILGGGLPVGRMIEVFGDASCGKSTLASHIVASYQKQGKLCLWADVEHALDPDYMKYCGVDLNKLCTFAPNSAEEALEAVRTSMKLEDEEGNPVLSLIVIDSIAALVPAGDLEDKKEIGTTMVGSLARLMSNSLKQLITLAAEKNITLLCLNQERGKNLIGGYGPKTGTTGGKAVEYYSSIRLDLNRVNWIEEAKEKTGQVVSIQTVKNKTHTPFKKAEIPFIFPVERNGKIVAGIDVFADTVNIALDKNIIEQHGAWFLMPHKEKKVPGLQKVYDYYLENEEHFLELKQQVLNLQ